MGQSDETPDLGEKIQQLEHARDRFISYLKGLRLATRDQLILKNYQQQIAQRTPWLNQSPNTNPSLTPRSPGDDVSPADWGTKVSRIIDQIQHNLDQKDQILNQFMKQFVGIGDSDRQVLLEVFKKLDLIHLQKELLILSQTFSEY